MTTGAQKAAALPALSVKNFGPIRSADVELGALTVLVGPQATGKSILLQLLKLLVDVKHVKAELKRAGIDWAGDFGLFLDVYFGEGMRTLMEPGTRIEFSEHAVDIRTLVEETKATKAASMFFVPAQRVLTLRDGWPQAFTYYDPGVPFAVREFSEKLRLLMTEMKTSEHLFPMPKRLKQEFRDQLQEHLFAGYKLKIDAQRAQKRLVLAGSDPEHPLPFMVWSAGQREFVPLLLGLYYLMTPAGASKRRGIDWVVIEELEMGLHPRAISVVMLMVFELVARGYRVCVSTHSPLVLDAVWALRHLRESRAEPKDLLGIFEAPASPPMLEMAKKVLVKRPKVYYFDRGTGTTKDISTLDPESEEAGEAGWGGLAEFSGRANEAVARAVANAGRKTRR